MTKKTLFVAICGKPNVGKSTILNAFLQEKLSIVSPKVQTTRNAIRGIITKGDTQIIFVDTPGILTSPKGKLQSVITKNAWNALNDVDIACVVIDSAKGVGRDAEKICTYIKSKVPNVICILNKIDAVDHSEQNLKNAQKIWDMGIFTEIFPISARKNKGLDAVEEYLIKNAKEVEEWFYQEDDLTDKSNNFITSEATREAIFMKLDQELPYSISVETDVFSDNGGMINVSQSVILLREAHKKIVIGGHGSMIKAIRLSAEDKLSKFYNKPVELDIMVKIRENWVENCMPD